MTYSPEDKERGLTAWVLAGSSLKASELVGIPSSTLRDWRQEDSEQFDRLREDLEPRIVKKIAAEAESLAMQIAEREARLLEKLTDADLDNLTPSEKAATLRNLSTSKALQIDKLSSPLRERPSHVQSDSGEHLLTSIARLLGKPLPVTNEAQDEVTEAVTIPLMAGSVDPNAPELDPAG